MDPGQREAAKVADLSAVDSPGYSRAAAAAAERTGRPGQQAFDDPADQAGHDEYTRNVIQGAILGLMAAQGMGLFTGAAAGGVPAGLGPSWHTKVEAPLRMGVPYRTGPGGSYHGSTRSADFMPAVPNPTSYADPARAAALKSGYTPATLPHHPSAYAAREAASVAEALKAAQQTVADPTQLARLLLRSGRSRPPYGPVSGGSDAARANPGRSTLQDRINANQGPVTYQRPPSPPEIKAAEDAWIAQRFGARPPSGRGELLSGRSGYRRGGGPGGYRPGVLDFIEEYLGRSLKGTP